MGAWGAIAIATALQLAARACARTASRVRAPAQGTGAGLKSKGASRDFQHAHLAPGLRARSLSQTTAGAGIYEQQQNQCYSHLAGSDVERGDNAGSLDGTFDQYTHTYQNSALAVATASVNSETFVMCHGQITLLKDGTLGQCLSLGQVFCEPAIDPATNQQS